jgi:two-component system sensor histidine kinase PhoQ
MARRVWLLVFIGLASLAAAHGALWWETLNTAQTLVHARMEAAALRYASSLSLNEDGSVHVDSISISGSDFHSPGSSIGAVVLVNGHAVWASKSLPTGPFPDLPLASRGKTTSDGISGFGTHPEVFDFGSPGLGGNVHRLSWPVLLSAPAAPVGCPSKSSTSSVSAVTKDLSYPCTFSAVVATVLVVEHDPLGDARLSGARDAIFLAFCASFIAIALSQIIALRLVLRPVHRLTDDLKDLALGRSDRIEDSGRPLELAPMVALFNQLLDHETASSDLHRKALANLAHSFKTPLAIMSTILQEKASAELLLGDLSALNASPAALQMQDQIKRLSDLVSYYLAGASASGSSHFSASVPLDNLAGQVAEGLEKIHRQRGIYCEFELAEGLSLPFAEGDANELLGNLLDNAFKWASTRVVLSAYMVSAPDSLSVTAPTSIWPDWARSTIKFAGSGWPRLLRPVRPKPNLLCWLMLTIEDDGPGVPLARRQDVFQRGVRADERVAGHGVGLSIVEDLVRSRGGSVTVDSSPLGGARFVVLLPLMVLPSPAPV